MKTITLNCGLRALTREVGDTATYATILNDPGVRAGLGCGDNIRVISNGVEVDMNSCPDDEEECFVETRCNTKAAPDRITVTYGLRSMTLEMNPPVTGAAILRDQSLRAGLGCGDNIRLIVNGVELAPNGVVLSGTTVNIETRCNTKAA